MNRWDCQERGCKSSAVGVGGAVGLRAIGWYFRTGPVIFCPAHRPDAPGFGPRFRECIVEDCAQCHGEDEARFLQRLIDGLTA